jgi:[CysO sulfur-carrier protein]-S-L-cysteine hydrolase
MRISQQLLDQIVSHAQADAPNECCGIVGSRDGDAVTVRPAINVHASPLRFEIGPKELFELDKEISGAGLDWGAIYHSHTRSEPYPSQTDINYAISWPGVLWIIVGTAEGAPTVRTYEISDGQVSETKLEIA